MIAPVLDVRDVTLRFSGVIAVNGVSFTVETGELLAVIGPNGAGKTSLFNMVSGLHRPQSGWAVLHPRHVFDQLDLAVEGAAVHHVEGC